MTALNIPLKAETYSELLDHYIKTKQFTPAFEVLERMPPSQVAFSRFLNACSERHEMERAETAWKLMKAKGIAPTPVAYCLMIKGYGRMGNLQDALGMLRAMQREGKGFEATESTFCSLFDANLAVSNLDGCLHVIYEAKAADIAMNQVRIRRLVHALCLQRRVDDAFAVIETAEEMGVDADVATCVDLIALAMQCHCPHRVPTVFACISRRNYALDVQSAHTLVRLLSQIDAFQEALQVLNSLPENGTRADVGSYTELVSTAFRAGLGDACMALIKELLKLAPANKRPGVEFFQFCLSGYRLLKNPNAALAVFEMMEVGEKLEPNYGCFKEIICCLLSARRFKQGSVLLMRMQRAAYEPERDLVNVYIASFARSKAQDHHEACWRMYKWAQEQAMEVDSNTLMAVFDSTETHARLRRQVEVGSVMVASHVAMGYKRHEHLKRAQVLLATGNDKDGRPAPADTRGQGNTSRAMSEEGSVSPALSRAASAQSVGLRCMESASSHASVMSPQRAARAPVRTEAGGSKVKGRLASASGNQNMTMTSVGLPPGNRGGTVQLAKDGDRLHVGLKDHGFRRRGSGAGEAPAQDGMGRLALEGKESLPTQEHGGQPKTGVVLVAHKKLLPGPATETEAHKAAAAIDDDFWSGSNRSDAAET